MISPPGGPVSLALGSGAGGQTVFRCRSHGYGPELTPRPSLRPCRIASCSWLLAAVAPPMPLPPLPVVLEPGAPPLPGFVAHVLRPAGLPRLTYPRPVHGELSVSLTGKCQPRAGGSPANRSRCGESKSTGAPSPPSSSPWLRLEHWSGHGGSRGQESASGAPFLSWQRAACSRAPYASRKRWSSVPSADSWADSSPPEA